MVLTMNKIIWFFVLLLTVSCASNTTQTSIPISTGWSDEDTYTVRVTDTNEDNAVQSAKHKILKDIVDVRVRNNSRYTDIIKIRDEFDIPLRYGRIIKQERTADGLMIYYQIRDKGLKKKFQRQ
jgi:hypothetical protein